MEKNIEIQILGIGKTQEMIFIKVEVSVDGQSNSLTIELPHYLIQALDRLRTVRLPFNGNVL